MNVDTGHIVKDIKEVPEELRQNYTQVPTHLQKKAKKVLAKRYEGWVSLQSKNPLSKWAKIVRMDKARKRKQIARLNRRIK